MGLNIQKLKTHRRRRQINAEKVDMMSIKQFNCHVLADKQRNKLLIVRFSDQDDLQLAFNQVKNRKIHTENGHQKFKVADKRYTNV